MTQRPDSVAESPNPYAAPDRKPSPSAVSHGGGTVAVVVCAIISMASYLALYVTVGYFVASWGVVGFLVTVSIAAIGSIFCTISAYRIMAALIGTRPSRKPAESSSKAPESRSVGQQF